MRNKTILKHVGLAYSAQPQMRVSVKISHEGQERYRRTAHSSSRLACSGELSSIRTEPANHVSGPTLNYDRPNVSGANPSFPCQARVGRMRAI